MRFFVVFVLFASWLIVASIQGYGSEHVFTLLVGIGVGMAAA